MEFWVFVPDISENDTKSIDVHCTSLKSEALFWVLSLGSGTEEEREQGGKDGGSDSDNCQRRGKARGADWKVGDAGTRGVSEAAEVTQRTSHAGWPDVPF